MKSILFALLILGKLIGVRKTKIQNVFINFPGISGCSFCSELRSNKAENNQSDPLCLDLAEFRESVVRVMNATSQSFSSIYDRDSIARLILFVDHFYQFYHEHEWAASIVVRSLVLVSPGGPIMPMIANATIEILMHNNTKRMVKKSLFQLWDQMTLSNRSEYEVFIDGKEVVVVSNPKLTMASTSPSIMDSLTNGLSTASSEQRVLSSVIERLTETRLSDPSLLQRDGVKDDQSIKRYYY